VISRKTFDLPKLDEPFGVVSAFTKRFPLGQYSQTVAEAATHRYLKTAQAPLLP
jgi:2-methylcitrate dehydratase